jgi:hypothetical protein
LLDPIPTRKEVTQVKIRVIRNHRGETTLQAQPTRPGERWTPVVRVKSVDELKQATADLVAACRQEKPR